MRLGKSKCADHNRIPFFDTINEKEKDISKTKTTGGYFPNRYYEILLPYDKISEYEERNLLDKTEIQARIYNLLREFDLMDLEQFDFDADYEKGLGLDSLEWTAIVTSIEHEFHTVFPDTLFDHFRTLNDFVTYMEKDFNIF